MTTAAHDTGLFREAFRRSLPLRAVTSEALEESLRHVLDNPGSLVRPRLVSQIGAAYGMAAADALDLAIALEYFHTASLLFDDLPCMDNADQRRGVPCVHRVYGESGAILTALALINRAYALTWSAVKASPVERQQRALAFVELSLGVGGVLNGQSLDLHYPALPHTGQTIERIATGKTVALIRLTLELPAMLGGAGERDLQLLGRIAMYWGLAYQLADDLKDLHLPSGVTGKTTARDTLLDHPNLAVVMGTPAAIERLGRLIRLGDRTLDALLERNGGLGFLAELRSQLESEVARIREGAGSAVDGAQR